MRVSLYNITLIFIDYKYCKKNYFVLFQIYSVNAPTNAAKKQSPSCK